MEANRDYAVLFAELLGAAELYAREGDAAAQAAIAQHTGELGTAAAECQARVVKTIGARVMLLSDTADNAARAAAAMQTAAEKFSASRLALGVGFHCGPLIHEGSDVFGDAVNLAARLVEQAAKGQILVAAETGEALTAPYRRLLRRLYAMPLKGRAEEVELCELVWKFDQAATLMPFGPAKQIRSRLTLRYGGRKLVLDHDAETLALGREEDCGVMIDNRHASRYHCSIVQRNGHFVLQDRSTNGTYVTIEGDKELSVKRDELTLRRRGWISFGAPRGQAGEAMEFVVD